MAKIEFVEQSLRDGQQSLWGLRMRAGMVTGATPHLDRGNFKAVEIGVGGGFFEVMLRNVREEPWAVMDHMRASMPNAHLRTPRRADTLIPAIMRAAESVLEPLAEHFERVAAQEGLAPRPAGGVRRRRVRPPAARGRDGLPEGAARRARAVRPAPGPPGGDPARPRGLRVHSSKRGRELADWELEDPSLHELKTSYGDASMSDEEVVTRYLANPEDIEATLKTGPLNKTYTFTSNGSAALVERVMSLTRARTVELRTPDLSVSFRRA